MSNRTNHPFDNIKFKDSTTLDQASYNETGLSLYVRFRNGGVYHYFPVYRETFQEMETAESPGRYFNQTLRSDARVICTKIF